ncbi:MAG: ATP synthase F1 subunit epsilon [Verrucomicrobiota bacterium]|nr:ATP synthase F1 subunit epsilon [Verrucomicrobiota bacterium]
MPLLLEIITPEKKAYSGIIDSVILPTQNGEIGVLPGHIPLLAMVEPGELQVTVGGQTEYLAIDRGFVQVIGDKVSVLTEQAISVTALDLSVIDAARSRAEKALEEAKKSGEDPTAVEEAERILRFAIAQRLIKDRRR